MATEELKLNILFSGVPFLGKEMLKGPLDEAEAHCVTTYNGHVFILKENERAGYIRTRGTDWSPYRTEGKVIGYNMEAVAWVSWYDADSKLLFSVTRTSEWIFELVFSYDAENPKHEPLYKLFKQLRSQFSPSERLARLMREAAQRRAGNPNYITECHAALVAYRERGNDRSFDQIPSKTIKKFLSSKDLGFLERALPTLNEAGELVTN